MKLLNTQNRQNYKIINYQINYRKINRAKNYGIFSLCTLSPDNYFIVLN